MIFSKCSQKMTIFSKYWYFWTYGQTKFFSKISKKSCQRFLQSDQNNDLLDIKNDIFKMITKNVVFLEILIFLGICAKNNLFKDIYKKSKTIFIKWSQKLSLFSKCWYFWTYKEKNIFSKRSEKSTKRFFQNNIEK